MFEKYLYKKIYINIYILIKNIYIMFIYIILLFIKGF